MTMPDTVRCWNCGGESAADALFCPLCEAIQPPRPGRDSFWLLGVPRSFHQDHTALEASFKRLSRQLHPDRFATASPRERRLSLEHATALNDAWRTLRVPVKRAEYLLGLWGRAIGEEASRSARLPMGFLEEVMELREKLAEAKLERDEEARARHVALVERLWQERFQSIERLFAQIEAEPDPARSPRVADLELELHKLRYLQGILTEQGIVPPPAVPAR